MADTSAALGLAHEQVWHDQRRCEEAELEYQQQLVQQCTGKASGASCPAVSKCTASAVTSTMSGSECSLSTRIACLESDNKQLRQISKDLEAVIKRLEARVTALEKNSSPTTPVTCAKETASPAKLNGTKNDDNEDEDDFELFGDDDDEDAEAERVKQERVKAYEDRKSKKPVLIAKSNIILDIKPWDDETDLAEMEKCVRSIEMDGLLWGSSKLVPLAYTIKKLQISCVVEDDKVSVDDLEEKITAFEEFVQSVDIAAFNKI